MVINSYEEYKELISRMDSESHIATPILRDIYAHRAVNPILCVGVSFLNGDFYMFSVSHKDAPQYEYVQFNTEINSRILEYIYDYEMIELEDCFSGYINETRNLFRNIAECNRIVPITLWAKAIRLYHSRILNVHPLTGTDTEAYKFVRNSIKVLQEIENAGIAINPEVFDKFFDGKSKKYVKDNLVYSEYFPFTPTGRPSNRFGGINFSALNKSDGSRAAFVSRFENGKLLQLDFESYHLRLIGEYMGIELPKTSLHHYLATQYFEKEDISPEEYEEGKKLTFAILYGEDVETDIPLLQKIKELSNTMNDTKRLIAPYSTRLIPITEDATRNKVFNYFVQCLEFESTVPKLEKLLKYLQDKRSKLVLYTYDAVLIDCDPEEQLEVLTAAKTILGESGHMLRSYFGDNYNELTLI